MSENETNEPETIAVMVRLTQEEIDYMKADTMATATATAVGIYCRKHIKADREARAS